MAHPYSFTIAEARRLWIEAEAKYVDGLLSDLAGSIEHYVREAIERNAKMVSVDLPSELEGRIRDIRELFPGFEIKVRPRYDPGMEEDEYDDGERQDYGKYLSISGWAD